MNLKRKIKRLCHTPQKPIYITIHRCRFVCFIKKYRDGDGSEVVYTEVYSRDFDSPIFIQEIPNILDVNTSKGEIKLYFEEPAKKVKRIEELKNNEII